MYTIEFQKHGLSYKYPTLNDIDRKISMEIPCP